MKYAKKWISIDDQVDLLTRGKGFGCNNVDDLKRSLETIGYYRLSAYWFPYKTSSGDGKTVFREGTTFDEIMRTYEFDRRLRLLMFEAVARIEVFLRSRLAYFAAKEDGAFGYPDSARTKLSREYSAAKKSEQYIKHFANTYGDEHDLPPNMSRALSRDKFGQTPCFSGPGLIIWPASLPRWTCLDRRASSQSNIRGFAGRAAAASDRRGSPPRALYVAGVASQFVATAGGVTFGLKSLPAGVPREQRPRE